MFGCSPDNQATEFKDIEKLIGGAEVKLYDELKHKIVGLAVEYPLHFMKNENLKKKGTTNFGLYLVPETLFT